ncbi:precorrin-6y C5,15-methyltransferase (decarboxylating) subunit CbiE [Sphingomonas sp. CFBP8993]|uniref:precorrin-6y C5,15-methyltransferase (decarboxylating) subunit CbiE n=1 Tax=Sphingomonas sp. CFBP8993 TaxID=3096526 RepID=UPI002A6B8264|nr:precorrin-6y C5,15-methyltransferase (decarboxylating) subunit CbiE [Sphingomonas sp. CFBP8993]MDY0959221.1 precorrin-6y C5,15-methyltransferase (decarboxylating) subunit CbiE [Sphingomonas sp. CFBP8993]
MADSQAWLTIVGIGEDGWDGLTAPARAAIDAADSVMGAARHLSLLGGRGGGERIVWPIPFADGVPMLLERRGERVVMLASGDPFWFGAGSVVTRHLDPGEWVAYPAASTLSLAAARLGWPVETIQGVGLHARPVETLRPLLAPGQRLLALMRDGASVTALAAWLAEQGFGGSALTVLEALGGPRERVRRVAANMLDWTDIAHPVAVAIEPVGPGRVLPCASGLDDDWFAHDGQITKRPVRALALSALAPRPGELLWDIGTGSGSVALEWLLSNPTTRAVGFERDPARLARARANAARLGVERLDLVEGDAITGLADRPHPDAVFVGGGLSPQLVEALRMLPHCRLVAHAVTLETEALLTQCQSRFGGELLRIELAQARPLGTKRGWKASYPIVQWRVAW